MKHNPQLGAKLDTNKYSNTIIKSVQSTPKMETTLQKNKSSMWKRFMSLLCKKSARKLGINFWVRSGMPIIENE